MRSETRNKGPSILSARYRTALGVAATVGLLLGASTGAQAQAQAGAAAPDDVLEEVVVTGSRIRRPALDAPVPITSVGIEEVLQSGVVNLGDSLNDLPSLRSTYSISNSTRFIGTAGLSLLDLRGLGISRTLVMVNGRRHVTSSPGENLVDVNSIPTDLVERIDIVTGGNSAVYGSDAVAGVVNFVTKRDFEGIVARGQAGRSDHKDGGSYFASLVAGMNTKDNRGNVAVALEYSRQNPLYYVERDDLTGAFSGRRQWNLATDSSLDTAAASGGNGIIDNQFFGGVRNGTISDGGMITASCLAANLGNLARCRASSTATLRFGQRYMFQPDGTLVMSNPITDFRDTTGGGSSNTIGGLGSTLRNTGQLRAGLMRYSGNVLAHYDINDYFKPFIELKGVHIEAVQEGQPSFWQGANTLGPGTNLRCTNPYLTAQALTTLQSIGFCANPATGVFGISRFNVDFGGRGEQHSRNILRAVGGVEGNFADVWHYEVTANYGHLATSMDSLNNLKLADLNGNDDGLFLAINAVRNTAGQIVCGVNADTDPTNDRPDCVPINVLGQGAPSAAALKFVNTTSHRKERASQFVASAYLSGDSSQLFSLPGGPIGVALGSEYRKETASSSYDELTASGGTFLNAIQPFAPPDLTVKDVFAEIRAPLLRDLPFIKELTVEAAGRSSKYNNSTGTVRAFNLATIWAPIGDIRFRANLSTSVRAPTQSDLYSTFDQNFAQINDPCDVLYINTNPNRAANCAAAGVPVGFINTPARTASTAYLSGGNPTLTAERGRSYTIGTVLTPRFVPNFSASVDYYHIQVSDLISSVTAQTLLNECYNAPGGINNSFCSTINRNPDSTFADPALISGGVNFAKQVTEGVDLDMTYRYSLGNGDQLKFRALWTHVIRLDNYTNPASPVFANRQLSELGDPEDAGNISVGYTHGKLDLTYTLRYIGRMTIGNFEDAHSVQGRLPENIDRYPYVWYPSVKYHGVRATYYANDTYSGYFGIDNLENTRPPLGQLGTTSGDPYDNMGRYFYLGINAKLK